MAVFVPALASQGHIISDADESGLNPRRVPDFSVGAESNRRPWTSTASSGRAFLVHGRPQLCSAVAPVSCRRSCQLGVAFVPSWYSQVPLTAPANGQQIARCR